MSSWDIIAENLSRLSTEYEKQTGKDVITSAGFDIHNVILQAVGDLNFAEVIASMISTVKEAGTGDGTLEGFVFTGTVPAIPASAGLARKSIRLMETASLPIVDESALTFHVLDNAVAHIIVTASLGIMSAIGSAVPLLRLDRLLEIVHSIYGLMDTPDIYTVLRDERLAVEWRRPYRYWIESQLENNLPPTTDLITFLVREVITLPDFIKVMSYQGFSESVAMMYWDSHFVMPTTQEVYDMEALGMINEVQGKAQLVINDISPLWVDKIWDLRKRLPSRTETRMMLRRKKMPDELLDRIFRFERIHPDYIEYYKFMLLNWDIDSIYGRIINEAIGHYQDGLIKEEAFRAVCADHLATSTEVDAYTELAKMRQNERRREEQKDMWVALYKKNYQTRDSTTEQLLALAFDVEDIRIWLDKAEVDVLPKLTIEQVEYAEESEAPPE